MKKEIVIDGKTYVLKEESKCCTSKAEEFKVGNWVIADCYKTKKLLR